MIIRVRVLGNSDHCVLKFNSVLLNPNIPYRLLGRYFTECFIGVHQVSLVGLPALLVLLQHLEFFPKIHLLVSSLYVQPAVHPVTSLAALDSGQLSASNMTSQATMTTAGQSVH